MKLYHTTYAAEAILRDGFRDGEGYYLTAHLWSGVWLADRPLDINEGADGDTVLCLDIPEEAVRPYEWIKDFKGYREFLVPASLVNKWGPITIEDRFEYWEPPSPT